MHHIGFKVDDYEGMTLKEIRNAISEVRGLARAHHPEFTTWHEVYGVLKEELDELWDSIRADDPDPDELIGLAATAQLAILEMCKEK